MLGAGRFRVRRNTLSIEMILAKQGLSRSRWGTRLIMA